MSSPLQRGRKHMSKRVFDIALALPLLVLSSPLLVIIALVVKLADRGPVLYRGRRIGRDGVEFEMYKFRTMVVNAEALGGSSTSDNDPRLTTAGRWLRRWKLDELPQLFNVVRGEMSIVGPRPQVAWDVLRYDEAERRLLSVKPGMTDWASIRFRNEGAILATEDDPDEAYDRLIRPEKIALGLAYVDNWSAAVDVRILFATVRALWGPREHTNAQCAVGSLRSARAPRSGDRSSDLASITEDWTTRANPEQWRLARLRYGVFAELAIDETAVEVGCGTCYGLAKLLPFANLAVGVDISDVNLGRARTMAPTLALARADACNLPLRDASVGVLACLEALYYIPDHERFFAEVGRVVRPGGHILITLPNSLRPMFSPSPHSFAFPTAARLRSRLSEHGFSVDVYGAEPIVPNSRADGLIESARRAAVRLHLVPSTMRGREAIKRIVYRRMRLLQDIDVSHGLTNALPLNEESIRVPPFRSLIVLGRRTLG